MRVLFAAAEADPLVKVGGLGDVARALPQALAKSGQTVGVFVPRYRELKRGQPIWTGSASLGSLTAEVEVSWQSSVGQVEYFTIGFVGDSVELASPTGYGADNILPFILLSRALAAFATRWKADVVHCNDWHFAHACANLALPSNASAKPRTVLTIHNHAYQGEMSARTRAIMNDEGYVSAGSILAQAARYAGVITTVSEQYRTETLRIPEPCELAAILREREDLYIAVPNGLDYEIFNPQTDPYLPVPFDYPSLSGKAVNKAELQAISGLDVRDVVPVICFVGRLVRQKGPEILAESIPRLIDLGAQIIVVGRGKELEPRFEELNQQHANLAFHPDSSESIARLAYAGSDVFLAPSEYEPFGLSALIALRYGCVPVVRAVGGMIDTIASRNLGVWFRSGSVEALARGVSSAVRLVGDRSALRRFQARGMSARFRWDESAAAYIGLYEGRWDTADSRPSVAALLSEHGSPSSLLQPNVDE